MEILRIVEGNPGALAFLVEACRINSVTAEASFKRMKENGITGDKLYILWNDCCGRDTYLAMSVMMFGSIGKIKEHINYGNGVGIPFTDADMAEA